MSTCGELLRSIESKDRLILAKIKKRHINILLERINSSITGLITLLSIQEVKDLFNEVGSIPSIHADYIKFTQGLTSLDSEYSIPSLIHKLKVYGSTDDRNSFITSIENDWSSISQIVNDSRLDVYIALVTRDIDFLGPIIQEYNTLIDSQLSDVESLSSEQDDIDKRQSRDDDGHTPGDQSPFSITSVSLRSNVVEVKQSQESDEDRYDNMKLKSSQSPANDSIFLSNSATIDSPELDILGTVYSPYKKLFSTSGVIPSFRPMRLQNFVKIHQVGQGAYGDVWLAEDIVNKIPVALKKLKLNEEREGFPKNAIREIVLLNSLKHKNIVDLLGITYSNPDNENSKENVWMVFEYLPFDLSGYIEALRDPREKCDKLIRPSIWLSIGEVKTIMKQLFRAISYCHRNNVLHRDLKTANLLMTHDGIIKLADFGLARFLPHGKGLLTNRVVTLWYRPPELLLGSEHYDYAVDMWSIGCIFAELISGTHIFAADKESIILKLICEHLGLPDELDLKYLRTLPLWNDKNANPLHPEKLVH